MRLAPIKTAASFDEFLEFESTSLERHEFVDGNLFVMAGGTDRQSHVIGEVFSQVKAPSRAAGLRVYMSDVLIRTPSNVGYYPDVYICQDNPTDTARVKRQPIIIFEVLSDSTEMFDRSEKWQNYQTIPSLQQYILLSQNLPFAEVYSRQDDRSWRYQPFSGQALIDFPSLNFKLSLSALYADLPLDV